MNTKNKNIIRKFLKQFKVNKAKIHSYLRISFCILLATMWVIWLAYFPDKEKHTTLNIKANKEQKNIEIKQNISKPAKTEIKNEVVIKKEIKTTTAKDISLKEKKIETKNLTDLNKNKKENPIIQVKDKKSLQKKKEIIIAENKNNVKTLATPQNTPTLVKEIIHSNIHLPNTAIATRKVLSGDESQDSNFKNQNEIPLRKGIPSTEAQSQDASWLPKYLLETKELKSKIEKLNENLDEIATQLEVAGIISKPNGKSAVLIRNKATNKTKLLNKGEKYLSLTVLEINQNEVILGDENLDKKYIKKFIAR